MMTHLRACVVAHAGTLYNIPRHAVMTHCTLQSLSGSRLLVHGDVQAIQELRHRPSPRRTAPRRHPLPITTRETSCGAHFPQIGPCAVMHALLQQLLCLYVWQRQSSWQRGQMDSTPLAPPDHRCTIAWVGLDYRCKAP